MAIASTAHGNTKTSATATTTSSAITTTAAIGETIIVAVGTVATTSNTPTDTATNAYVQLGAISTNTERITLWGCLSNKSASPSITCTFGSSRYGIAIATYTGVFGFFQANTTTATGSTSPAHATLPSALQSGSWSLLGAANKGIATWSAGASSNLRNNIAGAGTTTPGAAIGDAITTTVNINESGANVWASTIIELLSQALPTLTLTLAATDTRDTLTAQISAVDSITTTLSATDAPDTLTAQVGANLGLSFGLTDTPDTLAALLTLASGPTLTLGATDAPDILTAAITAQWPSLTTSLTAIDTPDTLTANVTAVWPTLTSTLGATDARDTLAAQLLVLSTLTTILSATDAIDTLILSVALSGSDRSSSGDGNMGAHHALKPIGMANIMTGDY